MTRESKLSLIIGFMVVLVVMVLISDYLSSANSDAIDPNSGLDHPQPIAHLPTKQEQRSKLEDTIARATPTRATDPHVDDSPVIISQATTRSPDRSPSLLEQMRDSVSDSVDTIRNTRPPVLAARTERPRKATPRTYTVRPNDSLYAIAREVLGDGNRWREIYAMNTKLLGPDPVLQPGMVLTLPGEAIVADRSPQRSSTADATTYTVQPGDVLGMISQKLLGTSKRAQEIADLNGLDDLDDIRVDMVLKIPAR